MVELVDKTIDVVADVRAVYDLWLAFEDYPRFMAVVDRVDVVAGDRLRWTSVLDGEVVEWDARIVEHLEDTRVRWEAVDGRECGEVTFGKVDAQTTRLRYQLEYDPDRWGHDPAAVESMMDERVRTDLRNFKEIAEAIA
jgi:uncharacterized membrane protein